MKVLLISHEFPPYCIGGYSTYMMQLVKYLLNSELRIKELCVIAGTKFSSQTKLVTFNKANTLIKIVYIKYLNAPPNLLWFQKKLLRYIHTFAKYDIIHTNQGTIALLLNKLDKQTRKRIIVVYHNSPIDYYFWLRYLLTSDYEFKDLNLLMHSTMWTFGKKLMQQDMSNVENIICVSKHICSELKRAISNGHINVESLPQFHLIYNSIEFETTLDNQDNILEGNVEKVVYVGRLSHEKMPFMAVKAVKYVNEIYNLEVTLDIFGDGYLKTSLLRFIKNNRMEKYVRFHGSVSRTRLMKLLPKYKVLILPSIYEGHPYVLLEANVSGLPVVVYDLFWAHEFVIDSINGLKAKFDLVSPDNLAYTIVKAINREWNKASIKDLVINKFSKEKTKKALVQLYLNIL